MERRFGRSTGPSNGFSNFGDFLVYYYGDDDDDDYKVCRMRSARECSCLEAAACDFVELLASLIIFFLCGNNFSASLLTANRNSIPSRVY